jgi:hypothetical protein
LNKEQRKRKAKAAKAKAKAHSPTSAGDVPESPHPQGYTDTQPCSENSEKSETTMKKEPTSNWFLVAFTAALVVTGYLQWDAIGGQLKAMLESNEALEIVQAATVSFSPSVKVLPISFHIKTNPIKVEGWQLTVPFSNDGDTSTKNGQLFWNYLYRIEPIPDAFGFPDVPGDAGPFALGPKESVHTRPLRVAIDFIKNVQDRRGHLYVYGWATYRDRFKTTPDHRTEFCYELTEVDGDIMVDKGLAAYEFSLCKHHNCYDEECKVK